MARASNGAVLGQIDPPEYPIEEEAFCDLCERWVLTVSNDYEMVLCQHCRDRMEADDDLLH